MREGNFNRVERAERVEKGLGVSSQELGLAATTFAKATVVKKNTKSAKPWPMVRLGDVCETISTRGHQIKQAEIKQVGRYPVVTQSENEIEGFTDDNICINDVPIVLFGDHTCVVKAVGEPFVVGADGTKLLKPRGVDFEYLVFIVKKVASGLVDGKYRRHYSDLVESVIPLPPLSVQKEIVERLEKELGEADKVAAEFKRMVELADTEFKAELDETFNSLSANSAPPREIKNDGCVGFVTRGVAEDAEKWPMVRLGDVGQMIRGRGIKRAETIDDGRPCIRYGEIYTSFNIILDRPRSFVSDEIYENSVHIKNGDLVFTLTGENKEEIGKTLVYLGEEEIAAGGDLAVWSDHGCNPKYLAYVMYSSPLIHAKAMASNGQIIVHLSVKKMQEIIIPIPPLSVQKEIVAKLDAAKERCEKLKAEAERGLRASENLRKAILSEAFE